MSSTPSTAARRRRRLLILVALVVVAASCESFPPPRPSARRAIIVLGDATRRPEGTSWEDAPASTVVEVVAVEPLCHPEHPAAGAVTEAIEAHFEPSSYRWACLVAWCESRFVASARNGVHVGLFQVSTRYWSGVAARLGADLFTFDGNAAVARYILDAQGRQAWQCSP